MRSLRFRPSEFPRKDLVAVTPVKSAYAVKTTERKFKYTATVPKSDSMIYNLSHTYDTFLDWPVPVTADISATIYFKAKTNGNLEIIDISHHPKQLLSFQQKMKA